jgi:hypothetical protein
MTPDDIARRVGVTGLRVRGLLRQMYPRQAPGSGGRWELSAEQVDEVLAYFGGVRTGTPSTGRSEVPFTPTVPADWFWEGHVQDRVAAHLRTQGWSIARLANTAARSTGPDIEARRGPDRLIVEVKGFPSIGYRDPRRAAEIKRTNPTLQARHWFADALLKVVRQRGTEPGDLVAMAFPDFERYRSLCRDTSEPLAELGIGVMLVTESGKVVELLRPSASS